MLDSANPDEIRKINELGLLDGVTTNPVIIKKTIQKTNCKEGFEDLAKEILRYTKKRPCFSGYRAYKRRDDR